MSTNNLENIETVAGHKPPHRKRMSERQLAANRANARKCTGPTSPAGKARSRFNALKHGLCAGNVCLPGDDLEEYERRRHEYIDYYQPANLVEWDLVEDLVAARWRKNRIIKVERNLILDTVMRARIDLEKHYHELSLDAETSLAIRELIDESGSLRLIDRYENRLQRNIVTTTKLLDDIQRNRPPVQDGPEPVMESITCTEPEPPPPGLPNETIPTAGHTGEPALTPIGNATKPHTIIPKPQQTEQKRDHLPVPCPGEGAAAQKTQPKPAVMAAAATCTPQPDQWQPLADNWQLTTDN